MVLVYYITGSILFFFLGGFLTLIYLGLILLKYIFLLDPYIFSGLGIGLLSILVYLNRDFFKPEENIKLPVYSNSTSLTGCTEENLKELFDKDFQ